MKWSKLILILTILSISLIGSVGPAAAQDDQAEWTVFLNTLCCGEGEPLTLEVTIDSVSHSSTRGGCTFPTSNGSSFTDPGEEIPLQYDITWCGGETSSGTTTVEFIANYFYEFDLFRRQDGLYFGYWYWDKGASSQAQSQGMIERRQRTLFKISQDSK